MMPAMLSEEARATKERILLSAERCFSAKGFARTTLKEIGAEARVTPPLISHYFGSKEALIEAVVHAVVQDYDAAQQPQWQRVQGELGFFVVGMVVLFRWVRDRPRLTRLIMWARLEQLTYDARPVDAIWAKVAERFAAGVHHGVLRDDTDPDAMLTVVDALIKGYWDRYDSYIRARKLAGAERLRFDQTMERTIVAGLLRMIIHSQHLPQALELLERELDASQGEAENY